MSATQRDRIKVVCRIRPENKLEKEGNYQKCVTYEDLSISVNVRQTTPYRIWIITVLLLCSVSRRVK